MLILTVQDSPVEEITGFTLDCLEIKAGEQTLYHGPPSDKSKGWS